MRTLGIVTVTAAGAAALALAVVGVLSIPDIRRYLKMRSM